MSKPFRLLARLRKYNGQTSLAEWSSTEMMQNLKAIDDAFENIEKRLFLGPEILTQSFGSSLRLPIPNTEVRFNMSAENFASYGFKSRLFLQASSFQSDFSSLGNCDIFIMKRNLKSGISTQVGGMRLNGATLYPAHNFYIELLPPGSYSYYLEGALVGAPNLTFNQIQFFAKVG